MRQCERRPPSLVKCSRESSAGVAEVGNLGGCFKGRRSIRRHQLPTDLNFGLSDYYQRVNQVKFFPLDDGVYSQFNGALARILDAWVEMLAQNGLR